MRLTFCFLFFVVTSSFYSCNDAPPKSLNYTTPRINKLPESSSITFLFDNRLSSDGETDRAFDVEGSMDTSLRVNYIHFTNGIPPLVMLSGNVGSDRTFAHSPHCLHYKYMHKVDVSAWDSIAPRYYPTHQQLQVEFKHLPRFDTIKVKSVTASALWMFSRDQMTVIVDSIRIDSLRSGRDVGHGSGWEKYPLWNMFHIHKWKGDAMLSNSKIHFESFQYIDIGRFIIGSVNTVQFKWCGLRPNSVLATGNVDTISFENTRVESENDNLSLIDNSGRRKKIILKLSNTNCDKVDFDYNKFHFEPYPISYYKNDENAWRSDIVSEYTSIINSQTKLNNQMGIEEASVELGIFRDKQLFCGSVVSTFKLWWNDYGFDKFKVIWSSLEVFGVILVLNLIFFNKLVTVYDIAGIAQSLDDSLDRKSLFWKLSNRFLLCTLYTGFIFYGVKFDFSSLKATKNRYVWLLLIEYILGLISVAFIANLIITK